MERRYKQDLGYQGGQGRGGRHGLPGSRPGVASPTPRSRSTASSTPKNFKDLTRERLRMNQRLEIKKDPKVLAIEAKLREPISLNMDKQPLSEAITFLQNYTGLNIVLDPKALGDEGLTSAAPVSLTVNNIQLKTALKLLLRPLGLTYKVEDEVLLITSPQATRRRHVPEDLLRRRPDHAGEPGCRRTRWPPSTSAMGIDRERRRPAARMGQAVAARHGPDAGRPAERRQRRPRANGPQVDMTPLIQLITTSIAPGTWRVSDSSGQDLSAAYGLGGGFGGPAVARAEDRRAAAAAGCDHPVLPEHQPDHPPHGGGPRAGRRPAPSAPPAPGPSGLDRGPVHHRDRQLLRADRRRLRLLDPVRLGRQAQHLGLPEPGGPARSTCPARHSADRRPARPAAVVGGRRGGVGGAAAGGGGTAVVPAAAWRWRRRHRRPRWRWRRSAAGGGGGIGGLAAAVGGGRRRHRRWRWRRRRSVPAYLVNPIRDHCLGNQTPLVVGTQGGGLYNFSNNLQIPFVNTQSSLIAPFNAVPGAGATLGIAFLSDLEVYFFLTAAQGDHASQHAPGPQGDHLQRCAATIVNTELQWYVRPLCPDRRAGLGGVRAHAVTAAQRRHPDRDAGRLGRPAVRANDAQPDLQHDRGLHHDPGPGRRRR